MFDVELELRVNLGSLRHAKTAFMYIRLMGDSFGTDTRKLWISVGRHDFRLPKVGKEPLNWRWEAAPGGNTVVLENKNKQAWAKLLDFPNMPTNFSQSRGVAYNLPIGPSKLTSDGVYILDWGVRVNRPQRHVYDSNSDVSLFSRFILNFLKPSGWVFDSSGGIVWGGGVGIGGSNSVGHFTFKRFRPGGAETSQIDYLIAGAGIQLPGFGVSESEDCSSWGTQVMTGTNPVPGPFRPERFEGGLLVVDLGAGLSGGVGGTYDAYLVLFTDQAFAVKLPNPLSIKAAFICHGPAKAVGSLGFSAQFMGYGGKATLHRT